MVRRFAAAVNAADRPNQEIAPLRFLAFGARLMPAVGISFRLACKPKKRVHLPQ